MEHQIKVIKKKEEIREEVEQNVRRDYIIAMHREVDFHHKVAYRFEKAYKFSRKHPEKKAALNLEIIDVIMEQSDFVESDPHTLFYCFYFCIYYNNQELVVFLKNLIEKMELLRFDSIRLILNQIETNGVQRLRTIGESVN